MRVRTAQPRRCARHGLLILHPFGRRRVDLQRAHRQRRDFDVIRFDRRPFRKNSPATVRGLLALQHKRHRIRRRICRVLLRGEAEQDIADGIGVSGNRDALQRALAPRLDIGADCRALTLRDRLVDAEPAGARGRHRHRGQGVVVARHAAGFLHERGVILLNQRQRSLDRAAQRGGRCRLRRRFRRRRHRGGTGAHEQIDHGGLPVPLRKTERGFASGRTRVDVRAFRDQHLDHVNRQHAGRGGKHEQRPAFCAARVDVAALFEQEAGRQRRPERRTAEDHRGGDGVAIHLAQHRLDASHALRPQRETEGPRTGAFHVGPAFEQQPEDGFVAGIRRFSQRCRRTDQAGRRSGRIGAVIEKQLHNRLAVGHAGRDEQRGTAVVGLRIHDCPAIEEQRCRVDVVDRTHQRRGAGLVLHVHVSA